MQSTEQMLMQYRQAYNSQTADMQQSTSNQRDDFLPKKEITFEEKAAQEEARTLDLFKRQQGFNQAPPAMPEDPDRRARFEEELNNSDFMRGKGDKLKKVLTELRSAIEDPNSPLDEQSAVALFQKIYDEQFKDGDK